MNTPKKPSWFKIWDLVSFGIPIVAIVSLNIYMMVHGFEAKHPTQAIILCWVVAAAFLGIYLRLLRMRFDTMKQYRWYPTYGFMLLRGEYQLPEDGVLDGLIWKTIQLWSKHYPGAEEIIKSDINWVSFHKDLDENNKNAAHAKVNGFTVAVSHVMAIDYDTPTDPIDKTALGHEVGHVIFGFSTKNWDQDTEHEYIKRNALP